MSIRITNPQLLCGWGIWSDDNRTFLEAETAQAVDTIAEHWRSNPQQYPGMYRGLPALGTPPRLGRRLMLFEVARKLLGRDTENYPQQVGDCVSHGGKNAIEHLQVFEIANGDREAFKPVFPPYLYGTGRVQIGGGRLRGDGSLGVWQAQAVMKYGAVPSDAPGCPPYSGEIAREWGARPGPPREFLELGATHLVRSAALVSTWEELVAAVCNGYPVTIASNVGFTMEVQRDGFHYRQGQWAHQMCVIGVDDEYADPYACILNSWGDAHGRLKDLTTGEDWPVGTLRVRKRDIEAILAQGDSFAYSSFDGFPSRELPSDFFMPW